MPSYMKEDNNKLYFTGDGEIIYYVPEKYFNLKVAAIICEVVEVMGIFAYGLFGKSGKAEPIRHFKCPTMIQCKPSKIEKVNHFQLEGSNEENSYRLLHFQNGDELMCSTSVTKGIENVEKFMNLLIRGNLPDYIPYNELQDYMILNAQLNGFSYKVSNQILGMMISELCRDPNNLSIPFRYSNMSNMSAYKAIAISRVPKYTSPYTAITSENPDEAIAGAMITTGTGKSPLERVMMN